MPVQLRVIVGRDSGRIFELTEGQLFLIGRDLGTNTRLKDPQVAMIHCQVMVDKARCFITDRSSSGGTFVNGNRITESDLKPGDVVRVGDTQLRFVLGT